LRKSLKLLSVGEFMGDWEVVCDLKVAASFHKGLEAFGLLEERYGPLEGGRRVIVEEGTLLQARESDFCFELWLGRFFIVGH